VAAIKSVTAWLAADLGAVRCCPQAAGPVGPWPRRGGVRQPGL